MSSNLLASRWAATWAAISVTGILALLAQAKEPSLPPAAKTDVVKPATAEPAADGGELFAREWLPNDSRAHGGDGLGPVFNDSSCVACHNQGGAGGGGSASKNVDIITAFSLSRENIQAFVAPPVAPQATPQTLPQGLFDLAFGAIAPPVLVPRPAANGKQSAARHVPTAEERKLAKQREKEQLMKIHPGFASARSVVLHHFSTDPRYEQWRSGLFNRQNLGMFDGDSIGGAPFGSFSSRSGPTDTVFIPQQPRLENNPEVSRLQNDVRLKHSEILNSTIQAGNVQISHSQRNPTALFGVGLIDAIPEKAIVELATLERAKYPKVAGRPARQKDDKIGRFGWKAQKPSLEDFTLTACAVELGLNVPGHEQAGVPLMPDYKAPGLDMNQAECEALVNYLRNLPAPIERKPANAQEAVTIGAGHKLFASVGCAACHVEKVGTASGIYSDLLLHDMGPELGDSGSYGVFTPDAPEEEQDDSAQPIAVVPNGSNPQGETKMTPQQLAKVVGALRQEWRTPPLWGVRDSGPYLHDGRADTLEQAIAFHGGQGTQSALNFFNLNPEERQQLIAFLKSLTAPEPAAAAKLAAR